MRVGQHVILNLFQDQCLRFQHQFNLKIGVVLPAKSFSANYVIRIYRFKENNPRQLVGVVEEVGVRGKKAFTNYDELWEILISSRSISQKRKQKRKEVE